MSRETTNLKLFKYDTTQDGDSTFNIDTALNENWDKIDIEINDKISKKGGNFTGIVKAQSNTSYTVAQIRNVIFSKDDANINLMSDGDIWIKYK